MAKSLKKKLKVKQHLEKRKTKVEKKSGFFF